MSPEITIAESRTGFLSPSGRCRSFSALADGYVRSEGMGLALLKPLTRALADGDPIEAVIRGSAINQDGRTGTITLPRVEAQMEVIEAAARQAGLDPGEIDYLEAHGTGTPLGDPMEARAAGMALRLKPGVRRPLLVGAVKANLGHSEAASGMAGLIKAVMCLKRRRLPANLHSAPLSPHIPFEELGLKVALENLDLPEGRLLAGLNSFGFGGSNAHVILENFEPSSPDRAVRPWNLRKFWHEPSVARLRRTRPGFGRFPGERETGPEFSWRLELSETDFPWLMDHQVAGGALFPAAGHLALMWAAARRAFPGQGFSLVEVKLLRAQPLNKGRPVDLRCRLDKEQLKVTVSRPAPDGEPGETVLARAGLSARPPGGAGLGRAELAEIESRCPLSFKGDQLYAAFRRLRFNYQGDFQAITSASIGRGEALARFSARPPEPGLDFHPAGLDAALQTLLAVIVPEIEGIMTPVPVAFEEVRLGPTPGGLLTAHARVEPGRGSAWRGRVKVYDEAGRLWAEVTGAEFHNPAAARAAKEPPLTVTRLDWRPVPPADYEPKRLSWLIWGADKKFGRRLAAGLGALGQDLPVQPDPGPGPDQATAEDLGRLVQNLPRADRLLWFCPELTGPEDCGRVCLSLAGLLRALTGLGQAPRLMVLTTSAVDQGPVEPRPWAAAVWGLLRVLGPAELPGLWGGLVDLEPGQSPEELAGLLTGLNGREDQWTIRRGRVFVPRLELVTEHLAGGLKPVFKKEPWYVLTGALGALGRLTAQWLRRRGAVKILMLGRRDSAELSQAEASFIKKLGRRVAYEQVDLGDPGDLDRLLARYRADGGLGGLIHMAAHSEPQTWRDLSPEAFGRVFTAKAGAAWNLHQAMLNDPPGSFSALLLPGLGLGPTGHGGLRGGQRLSGRAGRPAPPPGALRPESGLGPLVPGHRRAGPPLQPDLQEPRAGTLRPPIGPDRPGKTLQPPGSPSSAPDHPPGPPGRRPSGPAADNGQSGPKTPGSGPARPPADSGRTVENPRGRKRPGVDEGAGGAGPGYIPGRQRPRFLEQPHAGP